MPDITRSQNFENGDLVTAQKLKDLIDLSAINPTFITGKTELAAQTVATGDHLLIYDLSALAFRKVRAADLVASNLPVRATTVTASTSVSTPAITGPAGVDVVLTPPTGRKIDVAGALEADSINVTGVSTLGGLVTFSLGANIVGPVNSSGYTNFSGTGAVKIPVGTTAQRPSPAATGDLRYNTTTGRSEIYGASTWADVSKFWEYSVRAFMAPTFTTWADQTIWESPLITVPADETWVYEIHLNLSGPNNNGNTRPETVGAVKTQIGTTTLQTIGIDHGVYGGPMSNVETTVTLTSVNTPTPQRVRLSSQAGIGSQRNGWNTNSNVMVCLHRRKTADVGLPTQFI